MAAAETDAEMHALSGADERSECDDVWPCILLDMYTRLGGGEAGVSALQAGGIGAACASVAGMSGRGRRYWEGTERKWVECMSCEIPKESRALRGLTWLNP